MKTLPHALLETPGRLVLSGRAGHLAVVDGHAGVTALRSALAGGATGIALAGCRTGADIQRLDTLLCVAEAEEGREDGSTAIVGLTDGILPAPASPQAFAGKSARLAGLAWDRAGLSRHLGLVAPPDETGEWPGTFAAARVAVVLNAAAAGIPAYDSASDLAGDAFATICERSRGDGFFGRLAGDAAQVPIIESIYGKGLPE